MKRDSNPERGERRPFSIAPMMARTDRHYRTFMRHITRHTLLYTEMVTTGALIHGDRPHHLDFSDVEHPIALQLGGDDPKAMAQCARWAVEWGYDEVNINVGCPSDRVQRGQFGACLMDQPQRVADCVAAMRGAVSIPVTVKHRIGIDDRDKYDHMAQFVEIVSQAGCDRFSVHARKAWLQGLSPKENRTVPPLRYDDVVRLKNDFPHLAIEINGGITDMESAKRHLRNVDAVMVGRAAYDHPYDWVHVDGEIFGDAHPIPSRHDVAEAMLPTIEEWTERGTKLLNITRHMLNLFAGQTGTKAWKRALSTHPNPPASEALATVRNALALVPRPESVDPGAPTVASPC